MPVSRDFQTYVLEQLAPLGGVGQLRARRMFSGVGIFLDDSMFALLIDDTLYLKGGPNNLEVFTLRGMEPFVYTRRGKPVALHYYAVDGDVLEDASELLVLARTSIEAALRQG